MSLARLRERAARCRHEAQKLPSGIATELERLACDYDDDAARLEACGEECPYRSSGEDGSLDRQ
jgi:hypothetical protein